MARSMRPDERLIYHVDVNSAYLSWTSVARLAVGESDLRGVPACVGGDPQMRRGVVLAKSIPAGRLGVRTGEPLAAARRKCPELIVVPPDFALYHRFSRAFKAICREVTPMVESFSIDECFLDMTGTRAMADPAGVARELKDRIRRELGFTVNVGVGTNKLLAKMAGGFTKPDRVHTLFPEDIPAKLWPLPAGALLFVGKSAAGKLTRRGIHTVGELARVEPAVLEAIVGEKNGRALHRRANGIDDSPVAAVRAAAKGYSISTTLADNVTDRPRAHRVLKALADSVTARMRADGKRATCVGVHLRTHRFVNRSRQRVLERPTDITAEVERLSKQLLGEVWDGTTPLRLLGIALTGITDSRAEQLSLFGDAAREKEQRVDRTIDALRKKFGPDIIARGVRRPDAGQAGKSYRALMEMTAGETASGKKQTDGGETKS